MGCGASMLDKSQRSQTCSQVVSVRARYKKSIQQETEARCISFFKDNYILLLATPRDKKSTQQETETYDRTSISQITCLLCIWISMKLKRRSREVVETMIKCALDISENLKNDSTVDRTRGIHELTNHTHGMWNIWTSNSEIRSDYQPTDDSE